MKEARCEICVWYGYADCSKGCFADRLWEAEHEAEEEKTDKLFENGSLNDEAVLSAIDRARRDYEDGAIIEAHDTLLEVINAIDDFAREN